MASQLLTALLVLTLRLFSAYTAETGRLVVASQDAVLSLTLDGELLDSAPADFQWWQHSQLVGNPSNNTVCWVVAYKNQSINAFLRCASVDDLQASWDLPRPKYFRLNRLDAIAVDWTSGEWHVTAGRKAFVCKWDFSQCVHIADSRGHTRFFVAYDIANRLIFIVNNVFELNGENYTAEVMSLDGSGRRVFYEDFKYPIDITVDPAEQRLYWIDANRPDSKLIFSVKYDGTDRKLVGTLQEEWGISAWRRVIEVGEDKLFAIWKNNARMGIISQTENHFLVKDSVLQSTTNTTHFMKIGQMSALQFYSNITQPDVENMCLVNNGGCKHFCIPTITDDQTSFTCSCPNDLEMIDTICQEPKTPYLVIAAGKSIHAVNLDTEESSVILEDSRNATEIDYLRHEDGNFTLFWIDAGDICRGRWQPEGKVLSPRIIYSVANNTDVVELAVDWVQRLLVWIEVDTAGPKYERKARIKMSNLDADLVRTITEVDDRRAMALFLHLEGQYLGYTEDAWRGPRVTEMDMNADINYFLSLTMNGLLNAQPTEITLALPANGDITLRRILWLDEDSQVVHSLRSTVTLGLDLTYQQVIEDPSLDDSGGVEVFRERIFWTSREANKLYSADIENGGEKRHIKTPKGDGRYYDIKVLHPDRQQTNRPTVCEDEDAGERCPHFCFKGVENYVAVRKCACPDTINVEEDQCVE